MHDLNFYLRKAFLKFFRKHGFIKFEKIINLQKMLFSAFLLTKKLQSVQKTLEPSKTVLTKISKKYPQDDDKQVFKQVIFYFTQLKSSQQKRTFLTFF